MGDDPYLGKRRKLLEVAVGNPSYLEHVVRAYDDAIPFPFAPSVIDDRGPRTRLGVAPLSGAAGVLRRPALLFKVLLPGAS